MIHRLFRHIVSVGLALVPLCALAQNQSDGEVLEPNIRFETQKIDIGDTLYQKNTAYLYDFVYENTGTAPLIVNKVIATCPCLRVEFSTEPIAPGARDTLHVYFTPNHASKYTQRLSVFTNSPRNGIQLFAKGNFLKAAEYRKLKGETNK